jgi:hypothetical protein
MSVAAVLWVLIAGTRLKQLPADFAAMSPGLRLLFHVAVGTVVLPVLTSLAIGTDLPSLWALQGLFLVVVLIVCGTGYPIERFYTVNLSVTVAAVALAAVLIAAPIHAVHRNTQGYEEGRNLYVQAANEAIRQWREFTGEPLGAVGGDDSLAFATAFYSPDHPNYTPRFDDQYTWGLSRKETLDRGLAALCFRGQDYCIRWMDWPELRASRSVRREFTVQASLWGRPGLSRDVVVMMVPPGSGGEEATPESSADDFSASKRASE